MISADKARPTNPAGHFFACAEPAQDHVILCPAE
jgi:hypothetical protein